MAATPEEVIDLRAHQGAEQLRDVADRFEQVHQALRLVASRPGAGADGAEVTAWAEDTLLTMGEISEWMAEAWERVLSAVEAVADVELGPGAARGLIPQTSFVDAMVKASGRTHAA